MKTLGNKNQRFESKVASYWVKVDERGEVYVTIKLQGESAFHCAPIYYRDMDLALDSISRSIDADNTGGSNET